MLLSTHDRLRCAEPAINATTHSRQGSPRRRARPAARPPPVELREIPCLRIPSPKQLVQASSDKCPRAVGNIPAAGDNPSRVLDGAVARAAASTPGTHNCYAPTLSRRLKAMGQPKYQNDGDPRTSGPGFHLTLHPETLDAPRAWTVPRTIFVNSMSDLFHPRVPEDYIRSVVDVIADTPQHQYQVLTKRSKRLADVGRRLDWPPNLWMGVSVESARYAFRLAHLRRVNAAVRFVSAEPLLGPLPDLDLTGIHWLIAGGESGPRARAAEESWLSTYATSVLQPRCRSSSSNGADVRRRRVADAFKVRRTTRFPSRSPLRHERAIAKGGTGGPRRSSRCSLGTCRASRERSAGSPTGPTTWTCSPGATRTSVVTPTVRFQARLRSPLKPCRSSPGLPFELPVPAGRLQSDIAAARPDDDRWRVLEGDCNDSIPLALAWLEPCRWAPTFAFLDPKGLQVAWSTVRTLAEWRAESTDEGRAMDLEAEPAIARVLGLRGVKGQRSADRLDRLFGCRCDWLPIHQGRRSGALTPEAMRAEFVNLYRWRLEAELGYRTTHALQIVNTAGHPVYTLVFATDSSPGDSIMRHLYGSAATTAIPAMQARAQVARQHRRLDEAGRPRLPGMDDFEIDAAVASPGSYEHTPPWAPAPTVDDTLDLRGEPDIDPDVIDWDAEDRS